MMRAVRVVAASWLVFLVGFFGGVFVYYTKVWPYGVLKEIKEFATGHAEESTSLMEKIKNDLEFEPSRYITGDADAIFPNNQYSGHLLQGEMGKTSTISVDISRFFEVKDLPLNSRRENPMVYFSDDAPQGYRLIYGTFDFEEGLHGAVLLDPDGDVVNVWKVSQEGVEWEHSLDTNVFPHGIDIAPDGSIVVAFDSGQTLTRYGYCGEVIWRIEGGFSHCVTLDGAGNIWTMLYEDSGGEVADTILVKISFETGETLEKIDVDDVMQANPYIDIFGIKQTDSREGSKWDFDYWHLNDVEALPESLEAHYPSFDAGDLLVSLRSPNLVFVMDPETLEVKWWRQGLTRRQHDPDWNRKGTITIFDNNMHRGYSNIYELDPVTFESRIIVNGETYGFYTWWRGKHQYLQRGEVLVTSPDQGRVFEVDSEGNITFEFLNVYGKDNQLLTLSEAIFLPTDFFERDLSCQ
jgi:hypothetical protein